MMNILGCLDTPSSGTYSLDGEAVAGLNEDELARVRNRKIGFIFQNFNLLHDRTVFDNVALPLVIAGVGSKEIGKRVRAALDQVGLLGREQCVPLELSSGEQQRVGIARAVVSKPPILIADEPTGNLDPDLSLEVMHLFRRFNEVGVTVLVASHDVHLLQHFPVRRIRLEAGRLTDSAETLAPTARTEPAIP
jgi:cell division transport system ATP-binding protein